MQELSKEIAMSELEELFGLPVRGEFKDLQTIYYVDFPYDPFGQKI